MTIDHQTKSFPHLKFKFRCRNKASFTSYHYVTLITKPGWITIDYEDDPNKPPLRISTKSFMNPPTKPQGSSITVYTLDFIQAPDAQYHQFGFQTATKEHYKDFFNVLSHAWSTENKDMNVFSEDVDDEPLMPIHSLPKNKTMPVPDIAPPTTLTTSRRQPRQTIMIDGPDPPPAPKSIYNPPMKKHLGVRVDITDAGQNKSKKPMTDQMRSMFEEYNADKEKENKAVHATEPRAHKQQKSSKQASSSYSSQSRHAVGNDYTPVDRALSRPMNKSPKPTAAADETSFYGNNNNNLIKPKAPNFTGPSMFRRPPLVSTKDSLQEPQQYNVIAKLQNEIRMTESSPPRSTNTSSLTRLADSPSSKHEEDLDGYIPYNANGTLSSNLSRPQKPFVNPLKTRDVQTRSYADYEYKQLTNIGNTCYMNATMQAIASCPLFVDRLIEARESLQRLLENNTLNRGKNWKIFKGFTDMTTILSKGSLGDIHSIQIDNIRKFHQCLKILVPTFDEGGGSRQQDAEECLTALLSMVSDMCTGGEGGLMKKRLSEIEDKKGIERHEEMNENEEDGMESSMTIKPKASSNPIDLMDCITRDVKVCQKCGFQSARDDKSLCVHLAIGEPNRWSPRYVQQLLAEVSHEENMDDCKCENCGEKGHIVSSKQLVNFGDYLIIVLKRFQYNIESGSLKKLNTPVRVPMYLNMTQFLHKRDDLGENSNDHNVITVNDTTVSHLPSPGSSSCHLRDTLVDEVINWVDDKDEEKDKKKEKREKKKKKEDNAETKMETDDQASSWLSTRPSRAAKNKARVDITNMVNHDTITSQDSNAAPVKKSAIHDKLRNLDVSKDDVDTVADVDDGKDVEMIDSDDSTKKKNDRKRTHIVISDDESEEGGFIKDEEEEPKNVTTRSKRTRVQSGSMDIVSDDSEDVEIVVVIPSPAMKTPKQPVYVEASITVSSSKNEKDPFEFDDTEDDKEKNKEELENRPESGMKKKSKIRKDKRDISKEEKIKEIYHLQPSSSVLSPKNVKISSAKNLFGHDQKFEMDPPTPGKEQKGGGQRPHEDDEMGCSQEDSEDRTVATVDDDGCSISQDDDTEMNTEKPVPVPRLSKQVKKKEESIDDEITSDEVVKGTDDEDTPEDKLSQVSQCLIIDESCDIVTESEVFDKSQSINANELTVDHNLEKSLIEDDVTNDSVFHDIGLDEAQKIVSEIDIHSLSPIKRDDDEATLNAEDCELINYSLSEDLNKKNMDESREQTRDRWRAKWREEVIDKDVPLPTSYFTFRPVDGHWMKAACQVFKISISTFDEKKSMDEREEMQNVPNLVNVNTQPQKDDIVIIDGDGNCLFRALSWWITGAEYNHVTIREQIAQFMFDYREMFHDRISGDEKMTEEYMIKMMSDGEWGTHAEIYAAATILGIDIHTYHGDSWKVYRPLFEYAEAGGPKVIRTIKVQEYRQSRFGIYLFNKDNYHYDAVKSITVKEPPNDNCYQLTSTICHRGNSTTGGHYVADVYHVADKKWLHCDDSIITTTNEHDVLQAAMNNGYVLVYSRQKNLL